MLSAGSSTYEQHQAWCAALSISDFGGHALNSTLRMLHVAWRGMVGCVRGS